MKKAIAFILMLSILVSSNFSFDISIANASYSEEEWYEVLRNTFFKVSFGQNTVVSVDLADALQDVLDVNYYTETFKSQVESTGIIPGEMQDQIYEDLLSYLHQSILCVIPIGWINANAPKAFRDYFSSTTDWDLSGTHFYNSCAGMYQGHLHPPYDIGPIRYAWGSISDDINPNWGSGYSIVLRSENQLWYGVAYCWMAYTDIVVFCSEEAALAYLEGASGIYSTVGLMASSSPQHADVKYTSIQQVDWKFYNNRVYNYIVSHTYDTVRDLQIDLLAQFSAVYDELNTQGQ